MSETMQIQAQNVKCGGCTSTIEKGLAELPGVKRVEAVIEGGQVTIEGDNLSEQAIRDKLTELGYPPA